MRRLVNDVRYALRGLAKSPGFTLVAVCTLALGIGLNTAVYTIAVNTLVRPLPFVDVERLAVLVGTLPEMGWSAGSVSIPEARDIRERSRLLKDVGIFDYHRSVTLVGTDGTPQQLRTSFVTFSYFSLLGARPALGRTFLPKEDEGVGEHAVVVLSHGLWQSRFGGDPGILGSTLQLTGRPYVVVGVMGPDFQDLMPNDKPEVWLPLTMGTPYFGRDMFESRTVRQYSGVARLSEGATLAQAQAELDQVALQLAKEFPDSNEGRGLRLVPLYEYFYGPLDRPVKTLLAGAVFVLLICCVNIATLLLVRGRSRLQEVAVRVALGAGRWTLVRQILAESVLLAVLGGALGILLAWWSTRAWALWGALNLPAFAEIRLDATVLGASVLATILTGLLFGLAPAVQLLRTDLQQPLQTRGRISSGEVSRKGRNLLVTAEVALALLLLVGAGLMVKSLYRLMTTELGFDTRNLMTLRVDVGGDRYRGGWEPRRQFGEQLLANVKALPGVEAASIWGRSMIGEADWHLEVTPEGKDPSDVRNQVVAQWLLVSPGSLQAMGIPLLRGRDFTAQERSEPPPYVAIFGERMANVFWPGQDAVGKRFYVGDNPERIGTVIGVAADVRHRGRLRAEDEVVGDIYLSYLQLPLPEVSLLVRFQGNSASILAAVQKVVHRLDPSLAVYDAATLEERLARDEASPRLTASLMLLYATIATLLAAVGLYGVLAYSIRRRTAELAMRSALGARPGQLLWMVIRQGLSAAVLGILIGLAGAIVLSRYLENLLYQVDRVDSLTYGTAALLLLAVSLLACYLPARWASSIEPTVALRRE